MSTPVSVAGTVKTFCQINGQNNYSIALDKNGKIWTWGKGGSLGNNSTIPYATTPVCIYGNKTFCKINNGYNSSSASAIDYQGRVWGWGSNFFDSSNNYIVSTSTPVRVCVI